MFNSVPENLTRHYATKNKKLAERGLAEERGGTTSSSNMEGARKTRCSQPRSRGEGEELRPIAETGGSEGERKKRKKSGPKVLAEGGGGAGKPPNGEESSSEISKVKRITGNVV